MVNNHVIVTFGESLLSGVRYLRNFTGSTSHINSVRHAKVNTSYSTVTNARINWTANLPNRCHEYFYHERIGTLTCNTELHTSWNALTKSQKMKTNKLLEEGPKQCRSNFGIDSESSPDSRRSGRKYGGDELTFCSSGNRQIVRKFE